MLHQTSLKKMHTYTFLAETIFLAALEHILHFKLHNILFIVFFLDFRLFDEYFSTDLTMMSH